MISTPKENTFEPMKNGSVEKQDSSNAGSLRVADVVTSNPTQNVSTQIECIKSSDIILEREDNTLETKGLAQAASTQTECVISQSLKLLKDELDRLEDRESYDNFEDEDVAVEIRKGTKQQGFLNIFARKSGPEHSGLGFVCPREIELRSISVDLSVNDAILKFKRLVYDYDTYWSDDFSMRDDELCPLSRFDILKVIDDSELPPIQLVERNGLYYYENGRHRHLRLLIRNQLKPWAKLTEGIHFNIVDAYTAESGEKVDDRKEEGKLRFLTRSKSKLFVLRVYTKFLEEVHVNDFKRRELPCFVYKDWTVKFDGQRKHALAIIRKVYGEVFAHEGLLAKAKEIRDKFSDFLTGLNSVFNFIAGVGSVSRETSDAYKAFKEKYVKATSGVFSWFKTTGIYLFKLLINVYRLLTEPAFSYLVLASLMIDISDLCTNHWKAQSLETVVIAGVSALLPNCVANILKKMSTFTSKKVFDDVNLVYEFFSLLSSLFEQICSWMPDKVKPYIQTVISLFGISEFTYAQKVKKLLCSWASDKRIMMESNFRTQVKDLQSQLKNIDIKKFFGKNKPLHDVCLDFERLCKAVKAYEETSRQEPNCFVFEGPPGCRKSVAVGKLIKVLGDTHYAHIVKCSEDSKDWYDSYNNESIFYMDDVGQMGKSQWRNLINWVSCVKLPLDCAEASLKDTKYFNSDTILLTTNNFMNLNGFTAKDCIETPEALWRRGYVFDFKNVVGVGDSMKGRATFKHYDMTSHQFVEGFPEDFKTFLAGEDVVVAESCDADNQNDFLCWLSTIVLGFKKMKTTHLENNTVTEADVKTVQQQNPFFPQGDSEVDWTEIYATSWQEFCARESSTSWKEILVDYADFCVDTIKELFMDLVNMITNQPVLAIAGMSVALVLVALIYKLKTGFVGQGAFFSVSEPIQTGSDLADSFEHLDLDKSHSRMKKVTNQVFEVEIVFKEKGVQRTCFCHALVSGRKIVLPYHLVLDRDIQLVVYKDKVKNHRLVDHAPVTLVFKDEFNDVAVVSLSDGFPSPFPKMASCFEGEVDKVVGLAFPGKVVKLEGILSKAKSEPIVYPVGGMMNRLVDPVVYERLHFAGMCGVVMVTQQGLITGMHVAGHESKGLGVSIQWSRDCRAKLHALLSEQDLGLKVCTEINDKVTEDCSGFKIKSDLSVYVPKNSNIVKSPLYGLFENTRKPANLSIFGAHTVKDVSKSSRAPIGPVDKEELDFAKSVIEMYFGDFDDLSEKEVVNGDEMLGRMNKKSSNGIFFIKKKEDCFDYDAGEFKPEFRKLYDEFEQRMSTGDVNISDIAWFETLKDELRNDEKKEPRSFRVSPVTMQVLTKKCFGKMAKKLIKERWFNEIMVGVNPFKDWPQVHSRIEGDRSWACDVGKYDKNMRVQVQLMVAEAILARYKGRHKQAARNLLLNIAFNIVVVNDDTWVLTHSLPSGHWLTALFNSLVNRVYTAMWYYRECVKNGVETKATNFHKDLTDLVFGDDRMNKCKNAKYASFLNALTMEQFFNSLGMELTDSLKGKLETPFQPVKELTFLKRFFRFHPELQQVTCPLDKRTLYSTMSWVDSSAEDVEQVMQEKIHNFQREIYLHYDTYDSDVDKLEEYCLDNCVQFNRLPKQYLFKLYSDGEYGDYYSGAHDLLKADSSVIYV